METDAPEYALKFSEAERRVVAAKYTEYLQTLQVIAALHDISGPVTMAPDGSGLLVVPVSSAPAI